MLKRITALLSCFLITCTLSLSSCTFISDSEKYLSGDQRTIEAFSKILDAIMEEDKKALSELFSKEAFENAADFEKSQEELLELFKDKELKYEKRDGWSESSQTQYGNMQKSICSGFTVFADDQTFYAAMKYCSVDSMDRENEGVISIYLISAEEWETSESYMGDGKWTNGIHIGVKPDTQNHYDQFPKM